MAGFPNEMKPIGYSVKERQGDWIITWEVVGYNEKLRCNTWAEQKRSYSPRPSLTEAMVAMDRDRDWQATRMLHKQISAKV